MCLTMVSPTRSLAWQRAQQPSPSGGTPPARWARDPRHSTTTGMARATTSIPRLIAGTVGRRLSSGLAPGIVGRVERANRTSVQAAISAELMVPAEFDGAVEVERRVTFLAEQLAGSDLRGWVLGVSGGVDSATAGRLCQLAAVRVRADGGTATFVAMRLPYRAQADEEDAQ